MVEHVFGMVFTLILIIFKHVYVYYVLEIIWGNLEHFLPGERVTLQHSPCNVATSPLPRGDLAQPTSDIATSSVPRCNLTYCLSI